MLVSHKYRAVFTRNPRCGSHTIDAALYAIPGGDFVDGWDLNLTIGIRHWARVPERLVGYTVATTCRNPFDRMVSLWINATEPPHTPQLFCSYVLARCIRPQFGNQDEFTLRANHVIRCEHMQEDFDALLDRLGINETIVVGHHNKSNRDRDWRHYYMDKPAVYDRVREIYENDFQQLDYDDERSPVVIGEVS